MLKYNNQSSMQAGKRRTTLQYHHRPQHDEIRKGPWKAEEDEVLIDHVKKHGPREWSSIRSNGLLRRTGKSCRLRWVNKLRPDLKTGMRFSEEEERVTIDLQAKFGNKWARIATYLPGRTDNDVKNFWSSRRKRLARLLKSSDPSSSQKDPNNVGEQMFRDYPSLEAPKFSSSSTEDKSNPSVKKSQSFSSDTMKNAAVPLLPCPNVLSCSCPSIQFGFTNQETKPPLSENQGHNLCFPTIPDFPHLLSDSQDFLTGIGDSNFFLDGFGKSIGPFGIGPETDGYNTMDFDSFIDNLPPLNAFDPIYPFPGPSKWT